MKRLPREILSGAIVAFFGYALIQHYNDGLEQVVKDLVMVVAGYYLGSSKGSADKAEALERQNPA